MGGDITINVSMYAGFESGDNAKFAKNKVHHLDTEYS
jgi:hypothetical protein